MRYPAGARDLEPEQRRAAVVGGHLDREHAAHGVRHHEHARTAGPLREQRVERAVGEVEPVADGRHARTVGRGRAVTGPVEGDDREAESRARSSDDRAGARES